MLGALWLAGTSVVRADTPADDVHLLTQAHAKVMVAGTSRENDVTLPYHWDKANDNLSGEAIFEIRFELPVVADVPYGLLFPRIGNTAQVWLNGHLLAYLGDIRQRNAQNFVKAPQYMAIPGGLMRQNNLLRVHIYADGGRRAGLAPITLGPQSEIFDRYEQSYRWRVTALTGVTVFSLAVGLVSLMLWLTQKEVRPGQQASREGLYLSAGIAQLSWMLRMVDSVFVEPPLLWPWWGMLQHLAYSGFVFSAGMFCHQVAGWHLHRSMRWVRWLVVGLALSVLPVSLLWWYRREDLYITSWYGLVTLLFVIYCLFYVVAAIRKPDRERLLVSAAGAINVAVGVRDWLVIRAAANNFEEVAWMRFSSVLFGMALGYIVVHRFRLASDQARDLMDNLAQRVTAKEQELETSYRELESMAREQARAGERARILRDMHDGVGSHISSAIRQLQSGKADEQQLMQTLRDSMDQLKLSIDAMNLPPGDITAMLANLRYRLGPRFQASDIELVWDVGLLPPLDGFDARAMRHLQYMVFEAISNVLQHAQASELRIELRESDAQGVLLRVIDNGRGFDPGAGQGKGLASLRDRAAAIGAQLEIESRAGMTSIGIRLGPAAAG